MTAIVLPRVEYILRTGVNIPYADKIHINGIRTVLCRICKDIVPSKNAIIITIQINNLRFLHDGEKIP